MNLFAQTVPSIALIMLLIIITQTEASGQVRRRDEPPHPLSKVALHRSRKLLDSSVTISASPDLLGQNGQTAAYVTVSFKKQKGAAETDWIGVFSPAKFKYFPSPSPCQVLSIIDVRKSQPMLIGNEVYAGHMLNPGNTRNGRYELLDGLFWVTSSHWHKELRLVQTGWHEFCGVGQSVYKT